MGRVKACQDGARYGYATYEVIDVTAVIIGPFAV